MKNKNHKKEQHQFSVLTPWDIDIEDTPLNKYCSHLANIKSIRQYKEVKEIKELKQNRQNRQNRQNKERDLYQPKKTLNTLPNLNHHGNKKRAASHCNPQKQQSAPLIQKTVENQNFKSYHEILHTTLHQKTFSQNHQTKTDRNEKREPLKRLEKGQRGVLQEISVKNFVIEGSAQGPRDKPKKRQSTYILKQKFAQFRKSMKFMVSSNKENHQMKIIRYQ